MKYSKSENIEIHKVLVQYENPHNIPYNKIGEMFGRHPNAIRAMMKGLRTGPAIFMQLVADGFDSSYIASWVKRPEKFRAKKTRNRNTLPTFSRIANARPENDGSILIPPIEEESAVIPYEKEVNPIQLVYVKSDRQYYEEAMAEIERRKLVKEKNFQTRQAVEVWISNQVGIEQNRFNSVMFDFFFINYMNKFFVEQEEERKNQEQFEEYLSYRKEETKRLKDENDRFLQAQLKKKNETPVVHLDPPVYNTQTVKSRREELMELAVLAKEFTIFKKNFEEERQRKLREKFPLLFSDVKKWQLSF